MAAIVRDDVPQGTARGNTCYTCGVGQSVRPGDRWVDFEQNIDFEGWLIVCEACIREAAALLGMVDPDRSLALEADLHAVQAAADELLVERDEARALVDLMRGYDERVPRLVVEPNPVLIDAIGGEGGIACVDIEGEAVTAAVMTKPARKPRTKAS